MLRISVVIPTYNRAAFLPAAVASALAQTTPARSTVAAPGPANQSLTADPPALAAEDIEVIVVDDGSTDDTAACLAGWANDPRVRVVQQANQGRSAARNHGARLARGEFLAFLDSDDLYAPGALAAHLATFARRPDLGLAIGGYALINDQGADLGARLPWRSHADLRPAAWLFDCVAMPGSVLLRRSWWETVGEFDPACEIAEDWDFFLRLAAAGCPMDWTRQIVCHYRQHAGSSIREIHRMHDGVTALLTKFFARPDLPPDLAARQGAARAWAEVALVKGALAAGQTATADAALIAAVGYDPTLLTAGRLALLEYLLTPAGGEAQPLAAWAGRVRAWLQQDGTAGPSQGPDGSHGPHFSRRELRQALARVHMGRFFAAAAAGETDPARRHLWQGVTADPTWLRNRGVLAFLAGRSRRGSSAAEDRSP
ncbi:glycosyltransferase [Candidatus Amarolinea dominans]|uniref:glycosyltransferase family 2 protein n=1 Tax=Candidatus Amarolinea dominans TaxID=3140696 RepID=UPI003134C63F|nr:glycosyltransferase [Anaerolineae bacterium]